MKNTTTSNILNAFIIFSLIVATSCSNNNENEIDNTPLGICSGLASAATEYTNAASNFQENPSSQSCNALRNAALNLIDAAQDCQQLGEQYENLEQAAQGWTGLDCSQDFGE